LHLCLNGTDAVPGLSAAGRQDAENVASGEHGFDELALAGAELPHAEAGEGDALDGGPVERLFRGARIRSRA
jgi:hypothetical protein